jgi:hypothetical protein
MALVEGHYGILESFERVARRTVFRRGFGLPGTIWESGMPELFSNLWDSERFLRRDDARKVGLTKGLGLPSTSAPGHTWVLTLLSAMGTPIARRFEIWVPSADGRHLKLSSIDCTVDPAAANAMLDGAQLGPGEGPVGSAWMTGIPEALECGADEATTGGLGAVLALPFIEQGRCRAVVGLYF